MALLGLAFLIGVIGFILGACCCLLVLLNSGWRREPRSVFLHPLMRHSPPPNDRLEPPEPWPGRPEKRDFH